MSESSQEVWRTINSESSLLYEVSNLGQVRRQPGKGKTGTFRLRYLNGHINCFGYHIVKLGNKNIPVHRLVAKAFVPNPHNYEVVNHLDGNKLNNKAGNLEWTTLAGNAKHANDTGLNKKMFGTKNGGSVLNEDLVAKLRLKYLEGKHNFAELAVEFGVARGSIIDVIHYKRWKHVPLPINFDEYMEAIKLIANKSKSRGSFKRERTVIANVPKGSQVGTAILNEEKVVEIREKYLNGNFTKLQLAAEYGVTNSAISDAIYTHTWAHVAPPNGLNREDYIAKVTEKEKERQREAGRQAAANKGRPLTLEQANEIRARIHKGETQRSLAIEYNVTPSVINSIWLNKTYLT